jgi:hypothetical protein
LHSAPPQRFDSTLSPYLRRAALQLPSGFNPRTATLARQWRQEAGSDDEAIVRRALQWITTDFSYTLDTPRPGATRSTSSCSATRPASANTSARPSWC